MSDEDRDAKLDALDARIANLLAKIDQMLSLVSRGLVRKVQRSSDGQEAYELVRAS